MNVLRFPALPIRREALEDQAARVIDLLDELDGPTEDFEPDPDGEEAPDEVSLQAATLAPDRVPAVRRRGRAA